MKSSSWGLGLQPTEKFYLPQDANGNPAASSSWAEEFQRRQDSPAGWADQFHEQMHPPDAWADQFAAEHGAEQLADEFATAREQNLAQGIGPGDQEYVMAMDNPFLSVGYFSRVVPVYLQMGTIACIC